MTRFRSGPMVHRCVVMNTSNGDIVEIISGQSLAWLGLVGSDGCSVDYEGRVVRLLCERALLPMLSAVVLRREGVEATETEDDVDCLACIVLENP
jgi:hypothetical protein